MKLPRELEAHKKRSNLTRLRVRDQAHPSTQRLLKLEEDFSHKSRKAQHRQECFEQSVMPLRPSVAHSLLSIAGMREGFTVVDFTCGSGTIPREAAGRYDGVRAIGSDIDAKIVALASRMDLTLATNNVLHTLQADLKSWAVDDKPGEELGFTRPVSTAEADCVVSDLPFGNRHKAGGTSAKARTHTEAGAVKRHKHGNDAKEKDDSGVAALFPAILQASARLLKLGTGRAVFLCTRVHARQLSELASGLPVFHELFDAHKAEILRVVVGGWPAAVLTLRRSDKRFARGDALITVGGDDCGAHAEGEDEQDVVAPPETHPAILQVSAASLVSHYPSSPDDGKRSPLIKDVLQRFFGGLLPSNSAARKVLHRNRVWWVSGSGDRLVGASERLDSVLPVDATSGSGCLAFFPDAPHYGHVYEAETIDVISKPEPFAGLFLVWKPAGLRVYGGLRTLENCLTNQMLTGGDSESIDQLACFPRPIPVLLTGNQTLECPEDTGCYCLAATRPGAVMQVLHQNAALSSTWRCVVKGHWGDRSPSLPAGIACITVFRRVRSLRFGAVSELEIRIITPSTTVGGLRSFLSSVGHPVLGDQEDCRLKLTRKQLCMEAIGCEYGELCAPRSAYGCHKVSQLLDKEARIFEFVFNTPEGEAVESDNLLELKREYLERYGVPEW